MCKRADSRYVAGRGRDWQKVKCRHTQELVVGGFTEGQGSRGALGSLLVGTYEGERLVYAGRVGSGFDEATLAALVARAGRARSNDVAVRAGTAQSQDTSCTGPSRRSSSRPRSASGPPRACCASRSFSACARTRSRARSCASGPKRHPPSDATEPEPQPGGEPEPGAKKPRASKRNDFGSPTTVLGVRDHESREAALPGLGVPEARRSPSTTRRSLRRCCPTSPRGR